MPAGACPHCGLYEPDFTDDLMTMHWFKECPMLYNCEYCQNLVAIDQLNWHYLNECTEKDQFRVCSRCKEPVHAQIFNEHDNDKMCSLFKNPNVVNRCPLCHQDHTPPGRVGWENHLIHQGCPNNPRLLEYN